jgi:hypothetical protein
VGFCLISQPVSTVGNPVPVLLDIWFLWRIRQDILWAATRVTSWATTQRTYQDELESQAELTHREPIRMRHFGMAEVCSPSWKSMAANNRIGTPYNCSEQQATSRACGINIYSKVVLDSISIYVSATPNTDGHASAFVAVPEVFGLPLLLTEFRI